MRLTTHNMPAGQQNIAFEIQPKGAELARWIISYFESQVQAGTQFREGQTVELGWSLMLLQRTGDDLEVFEPDFDSMPIRWCGGVNNTVRHLHLQRAVCELFACDPLFPTIRQAGIASPKFFGYQEFTMSRDVPADSDSGWVFAESGHEGSEGQFCSLYQLALQKTEIIPFLALPASSRVSVKPGSREVTVNGITKTSADCELLRSLAASEVLV